MKIRDFVDIRPHPTVVQLDHWSGPNASWISDTFFVTKDVQAHLSALAKAFEQDHGCGVFIVGQFGSGKSHLLAFIAQQLTRNAQSSGISEISPKAPQTQSDPANSVPSLRGPQAVVAISLLNYPSDRRLEEIVLDQVKLPHAEGTSRADAWSGLTANYPHGLLLIFDELSEFLRSKPNPASFHEDIRFLQFLGEWAQNAPLWIIGAMQEQIEHVGDLEFGIYRKIKDRYPLRFLLTTNHIVDLLADSIFIRKPGYEAHVEQRIAELRGVFPEDQKEFETLRQVFPLHPATLTLLEEVRDCFSQARGAIDFAVGQLGGRESAQIAPFLDEPADHLLTPDAIVDHFADLFELQPNFVGLAQQLLPYYRKLVPELFPAEKQSALAWKILKLLMLVYISPSRSGLTAREATRWLYYRAAKIDPSKNLAIIERTLRTLVNEGRFVQEVDGTYGLNLHDDGGTALDRFLEREKEDLRQRGEVLFETLATLLGDDAFHPFQLQQERWLPRQVTWQFHDRNFSLLVSSEPAELKLGAQDESLRICLRLPWGDRSPWAGAFSIVPAALQPSEAWIELAALAQAQKRQWTGKAATRLESQFNERLQLFGSQVRSCYQEAQFVTQQGKTELAPAASQTTRFAEWVDQVAMIALRRVYPSFERFAPVHGPLPRESIRSFARFLSTSDLEAAELPDDVRMIVEAYLVPMKLVRRSGRAYALTKNPENGELVRLILPLVASEVAPQSIYEQLQGPVYGLVPDQVTVLLLYLLVLGEIDLRKGSHSYWDSFETLPTPIQYDRAVPGQALKPARVADLLELCERLQITIPPKLTVLGQRRAVTQLRNRLAELTTPLRQLKGRLAAMPDAQEAAEKLDAFLERAAVLAHSSDELHAFQQLIFEFKSTEGFLGELQELTAFAQKADTAMEQRARMVQLLSHPAVDGWDDVEVSLHLDSLGKPPGLAQWNELAAWLESSKQAYQVYCRSYQERHDRWWKQVEKNPGWNWQLPTIAKSQHVGLGDVQARLDQARRNAQARRCRTLVNLDFQPVCHCEFDGQSSPISKDLRAMEAIQAEVEESLRLFFGQPQVRERIRAWVADEVEVNTETLAYLEEKQPWPQTNELTLLDRHLAGITAVDVITLDGFVEKLQQQTWSREEAIAAWMRLIDARRRDRFRFRYGDPSTTSRDQAAAGESPTTDNGVATSDGSLPHSVVSWCVKQSVANAVPIPAEIDALQLQAAAETLQTTWIAADSLLRLESLRLGSVIEDKIAGWLLDGHLTIPETGPGSASKDASSVNLPAEPAEAGIVSCIREILRPNVPTDLEGFEGQSHLLYRHHHRMSALAAAKWTERLKMQARHSLPVLPQLVARLANYSNYPWLLLDALALPLLPYFRQSISKLLPGWQIQRVEYASVSETSTTDQCYRDLLDSGVRRSLLKCNAIDELIHQRFVPLDNLWQLATAELTLELESVVPQLSGEQTVVVFADHGFRIASRGDAYVHGGDSALERTVPVMLLSRGGS